jgi:CRISPR system Cascade subunit CasE
MTQMTYLTRFEINAARREAQALLANPQRLHSAVMAAFTAVEHAAIATAAEGAGRILWRVDRAKLQTWLYLLSPAEPDLTHLVEQAGWPTKPSWQTRDYQPLLDKLDTGQRWAFRLTASPTRTVTDAHGRKKIHPHKTFAHQLAWLLERAERLGVTFPDSSAAEPDVVVRDAVSRAFRRGASTITMLSVTYDGALDVVDPDLLRSAMLSGTGRGKAYGCGLLTLAHS